MKFKVGDRVQVVTTKWDTSCFQQSGRVGRIEYLCGTGDVQDGFDCLVILDGSEGRYYSFNHLEFPDGPW